MPRLRVFSERSADATWLYDPHTGLLSDCNQTAVELMSGQNKEQFLRTRPEDLWPPSQPDGSASDVECYAPLGRLCSLHDSSYRPLRIQVMGRQPLRVKQFGLILVSGIAEQCDYRLAGASVARQPQRPGEVDPGRKPNK